MSVACTWLLSPSVYAVAPAVVVTTGASLAPVRLMVRVATLLAAETDERAAVTKLYENVLARKPTDAERQAALEMLGTPVKPEGVADFLWAITMLPEFQLIN